MKLRPLAHDDTGNEEKSRGHETEDRAHRRVAFASAVESDQISGQDRRRQQTHQSQTLAYRDHLGPLVIIVGQLGAEAVIRNRANGPDEVRERVQGQQVHE